MKNTEIIMTGGMKGRVGKEINSERVGIFGENTINDNGERDNELCETNDLKIIYFRQREKTEINYWSLSH